MADVAMRDLETRDYQQQLMKIAQEKNTIIFLPTGSGKTFIAVLVLKHLSAPLEKPYSEGGKISLMLVNTVVLVEQQAKVLRLRTHFSVGAFSGELNLDNWSKEQWHEQFDKYQIIVMTSQILVNLCNSSYIDLNKVNLIIFDECHHGVKDHGMRQLMRNFQMLHEKPRVLGLTATLLNGSCKPHEVMKEVEQLEATYYSKVAAAQELSQVIGFATNPKEVLKVFKTHNPSATDTFAIGILEQLRDILDTIQIETTEYTLMKPNLKPLQVEDGMKDLRNFIKDVIYHLKMLGTFGGLKALVVYTIQVERLKLHCDDVKLYTILNCLTTAFSVIKAVFLKKLDSYSPEEMLMKFSSDQVLVLIDIMREYRTRSQEELCGIIFVQRRFTAKILFHILSELAKLPEFDFIKPNFIVGFNNNPYNSTREGLFIAKQNKKVLNSFCEKKINLLVASNVLEEGIDMPNCSLVVKFDKPTNYRSYVQSKGRARHKSSLYYMMVAADEVQRFHTNYKMYQEVEQILNNYLVGKNDLRDERSEEDLEQLCNELEFPPYYTNGPGSAKVDLLSSIPLLASYCQILPGDIYTTYLPEWYVEEMSSLDGTRRLRVVILLPIVSPLRDLIEGPICSNLKVAKRAAALTACIRLHKMGELDDNLKPIRKVVEDENTNFLFQHYPAEKEVRAGSNKFRRTHMRQVPSICRGQLVPNKTVFIHSIDVTPMFAINDEPHIPVMHRKYSSDLCFCLVTAQPFPKLCAFPVYVSAGELKVEIQTNYSTAFLSQEDIDNLKEFHFLVFNDLLKVIKTFLIFDTSDDADLMLLAPLNKEKRTIDFDVVSQYKCLESVMEPTLQVKKNMVVDEENYLEKIVTPWYRPMETNYIVVRVCEEMSARSQFPSRDFGTFLDYYTDKYKQTIINPDVPLLYVKGLSKRLNCVKPRGVLKGKRRREANKEEMDEHLIAELCVKQEFPSELWIQASVLPTVLHHVTHLLRAEELSRTISLHTIGSSLPVEDCRPLELDEHLLKYEPKKGQLELVHQIESEPVAETQLSIMKLDQLNKEVSLKMFEAEYPWKDIDEPKDIDRCLDVSPMDILVFESFIQQVVSPKERMVKLELAARPPQFAITYSKDFEEKDIRLLKPRNVIRGPPLREVYKALSTAKANNIVNSERLETLGDSFLKFIVSLYIMLKYPEYDEGRATALKGRLVSNKNLFYLGRIKNIGGYVNHSDLSPESQWLAPGFKVPDIISKRILGKELSIRSLYKFDIPKEEQTSGIMTVETVKSLEEEDYPVEVDEENDYASTCAYLKCQYLGDKVIADTVEALLGAYFEADGFAGGISFVEWMGIIPPSENLTSLLRSPPPDPVLNKKTTLANINFHIPNWAAIEARLGYHFKNRAYLLQALTHSTYVSNRITNCYQRLEFLGDAVLDFLITCHIYETCGDKKPGDITDLRSALVNNNTFAGFTVRCGFHKFLLAMNPKLTAYIDKFAEFQENRDHIIDDTVLILLQEEDLKMAEHVDVPKVLGDMFEALAGAVYLDSGKDLNTVWKVFYKIMWKEIDLFRHNVPKNLVRELYEKEGVHPKFHKSVETKEGKIMIKLEFLLNGAKKFCHGFGDNKVAAKRAAAKIALRLLQTV